MDRFASQHRNGHDEPGDGRWSLEQIKREYVLEVLRRTGGNTTDAAHLLGIDRRTLASRLRRYLDDGVREAS